MLDIFKRNAKPKETVPLAEALEWIGLDSFPPAGHEQTLDADKYLPKDSYQVHLRTYDDNRIEIAVHRPGAGARYFFEGALVYNGANPLLLRLDHLFIAGQQSSSPNRESVESLFRGIKNSRDDFIKLGRCNDGVYMRPSSRPVPIAA